MRKTVEKKCFECDGVGLEVKAKRFFLWKKCTQREILNDRRNVLLYANYICKVCEGRGVYEVIE